MNVSTRVRGHLFFAIGATSLIGLFGCNGGASSTLPNGLSSSLERQVEVASAPTSPAALQPPVRAMNMHARSASTYTLPSIPNLAGWFDAMDSTTLILNAGRVASWHDKSGNGNDLAPKTSANAPAATGLGTSSALVFNGNAFLVGKNAAFSQSVFNETSVFMVTNQANATQSGTLVWSGIYLSNPRFAIRLSEGGASHIDVNNKYDGRLTAQDNPVGPAIWSASGSYSGHTESFSKNGTVLAHDAGPASSASGSWPLTIGATFDSVGGRSTMLYTGQISEILMYHRSLAPAEIAQVEGYLACKWSLQALLPVGHPYRSTCPSIMPSPTPSPAVSPTATPSPMPTVKPSPVPTVAAFGPKHVLTAEYFQGYGGYGGSASTMAQYTSWATGGNGVSSALAAGMKTYEYADPWIAYAVDNGAAWNDIKPGGAHADAESKTCGGIPVGGNNGTSSIFTDPTQTAASIAHYQNSINYWQAEEGTNTTAMFMDDVANQEYAANKPACNYSSSAWLTGAENMAAGVAPIQIIANGLINAEYANDETSLVPLLNTPNVMGGMYEDCYGFNSSEGMGSGDHAGGLNQHWTVTENTQIAALATGKIFWCYNEVRGTGSSSLGLRLYMYANFLLTYSANALYQTAMTTPSSLRVFPETGIVPTNPLVPVPVSVTGLVTKTGVYGREYSSCYYRGASIGACAIITNPDNGASHANPYSAYSHSAVLVGAAVLDGGSVNFTAGAPASLAPLTAAILTK